MEANDRINQQLILFSRVAERSIPIAQRLFGNGLRLLSARYGGLLDESTGNVDPVVERFETERLRERYGAWTVYHDGIRRKYGYRSTYVDELLERAGLRRDQLDLLGRPPEVDRAIEQQPWAWHYRRDFLTHHRSQGGIRDEAKARERRDLGLGVPGTRLLVRYVQSALKAKLRAHGYTVVSRPYRGLGDIYTNRAKVDGVALEIALEVSGVPITNVPLSAKLQMMPALDISACDSVLQHRFARGDFFEILEPFVPNFGCYRGAWVADHVELLLYAYGLFLDEVIPELEKACAAIEA